MVLFERIVVAEYVLRDAFLDEGVLRLCASACYLIICMYCNNVYIFFYLFVVLLCIGLRFCVGLDCVWVLRVWFILNTLVCALRVLIAPWF